MEELEGMKAIQHLPSHMNGELFQREVDKNTFPWNIFQKLLLYLFPDYLKYQQGCFSI